MVGRNAQSTQETIFIEWVQSSVFQGIYEFGTGKWIEFSCGDVGEEWEDGSGDDWEFDFGWGKV